ncbi:MAG: nucleotide exchange factor GrpE [Jiangellaceae bacterium]
MTDRGQNGPDEAAGPVVRDRRRLDPQTGEVRDHRAAGPPAAPTGPAAPGGSGDALAAAQAEAAERLDDLRRLQAEYVNYRRRVERDRQAVRDGAVASVLGEFLGVLDDIGRARDHGDLTGGFQKVGEALEATTAKLGLVRYGEPGDAFDPTVHEALMHEYSDEVTVPTCTRVLMPGYRHGDRVIRPARVAVAEPTEMLPTPDDADDVAAGDTDD